MIYSGSIYFLGTARPAYFQSTSIKGLRTIMQRSIVNMSMDDWQFFSWRIDNIAKELRKKSCAGASAEHGAKGVSMQKRAHDDFLRDIVASYPDYPGLNYYYSLAA